MSRLDPTLSLDITQQQADEMQKDGGLSVEQTGEKLRDMFSSLLVKDKPFFTANVITDIESGQKMHNFEAMVVGKFTIDDRLHLKLSTGDIVVVEFNVI